MGRGGKGIKMLGWGWKWEVNEIFVQGRGELVGFFSFYIPIRDHCLLLLIVTARFVCRSIFQIESQINLK